MSQTGSKTGGNPVPGREDLYLRIKARIRKLERASGTGLWAMVIFLLVSLGAYHNFSFFPDLSDDVRRLLGKPPPAEMISLALVIYAFSGIVRTLARMSRNIKPYRSLIHTAFFLIFYLFYFLSDALQDNFWAVFFAGISVIGLENYYLWSYSSEALQKEKELIKSLRGKEE